MPPERNACRLFLKEAGFQFLGADHDESFVQAIAQIFRGGARLEKFS